MTKRLRTLAALTLLLTSTAHAATLLTADDKTVTGDIKAFEDNALILEPKPGETAKIPLDDLLQLTLTWQERIAATTKPPTTPSWQERVAATTKPTTTAATQSAASQPATQEKPAPRWKAELLNGDRITGTLKSWDDKAVTFAVTALEDEPFAVPFEQLQALWTPAEKLAFKAKSLASPAGAGAGIDIAYVEKDGDVRAVAGQALGIDGDFLKFKWENEERKIRLERLVGLVLAQREQPPLTQPFQVFTLSTGEVVSGNLVGMDTAAGKVFLVKPLAAAGATFRVPVGKLEKVTVRNGRVVWLGDLAPASVVETGYFDRVMPHRIDKNLAGGKLTLTDGAAERGIAVHAKSHLTFDIAAGAGDAQPFEKFRAKVGFQQDEGKLGRASLRVLGDEKVLWEEPDLKGPARPVVLDLDVKGVKMLRLEANFGKDQDVGDQIVWADAKLVRQKK